MSNITDINSYRAERRAQKRQAAMESLKSLLGPATVTCPRCHGIQPGRDWCSVCHSAGFVERKDDR